MIRKIFKKSATFEQQLRDQCVNIAEAADDTTYFARDAAYMFRARQVEEIRTATTELHKMCMGAVAHVIDAKLLSDFGVPDSYHNYIQTSFRRGDPDLYGRFDLSYDGINPPKLLEYNADTAGTVFEAAVLQWRWLEDRRQIEPEKLAGSDQFNDIHETMIERWATLKRSPAFPQTVHFTCAESCMDDVMTTSYVANTAEQAGIQTACLDLASIGWDGDRFVDATNLEEGREAPAIDMLYKMYPWECMAKEAYGPNVLRDNTKFIEPAWKAMILGNKKILSVLWKLNEGHPNLLPAYDTAEPFGANAYVKKPVFGRQGAGISIVNSAFNQTAPGAYDGTGYVYQKFEPLPDLGGIYPVVGSFVVGGKAAGIGMREDSSIITKGASSISVPHYFMP